VKSPLTQTRFSATRLLLASGGALLLLAAAAAALAEGAPRVLLMDVLSPLCHQLPHRSFAIEGVQMGLCHRCTAVLLGLVGALLAPAATRATLPPAVILAIALTPMVIDWGIDAAGLWSNTVTSRVLTGLWGGGALGLMIGGAARK
jgi:uncharacterized membrane protein